jgi:DNA-directed RNA polymerase subunit RPC12/RpoP
MLIRCNYCDKNFYFDDLPSGKDTFCPDCGCKVMKTYATKQTATIKQDRPRPGKTQARVGSPIIRIGQDPAVKTEATKQTAKIKSSKSPPIAELLSIIGGFFGLLGIGHMYLRRKSRGLGILLLGLFLYFIVLAYVNYVILNRPAIGFNSSSNWGLIIFSFIYGLAWILQVLDARKLARPQ